jgi:simple sugar transport system ATP-binding protein
MPPEPPAAPAPPAPLLRLSGITKRFGPLVANDSITLELQRGEVLALLGENGAGKSTLVSILFGHYVADAGSIEVDGTPLPPGEPKAALAAGIGMVHQHFTLADNLSVLDNVMLGTEPLWQPFSRRGAARAKLLDAARRFGLAVDPDVRVAELSVGERQRVEILKALVRGARLLILDEPTAVLTPQESAALFATLKTLVAAGLAVIFISHKLDEVLAVSDRVAVLRAGRLVELRPAAGASRHDLAEAMVGRSVAPAVKHARTPGAVRLRLREATVDEGRARALLDGVDLDVHGGEVVAIAGVAGNGQQTLADVLCGLRPLDGGTLAVDGRALPAHARAWVEAGVARIPEDRHAVGVVGDLALWENATIERYASKAFARFGIVRRGAALALARAIVERFDVRGTDAAGLHTTARMLSGGNLQKLILGRALTPGGRTPALVVANQPTWGLDVGAVAYVHQQLLDVAAAGAAVLLISEDLDEVFALADRIAVMHRGRLGASRPAAQWTPASIGLAMAGGAAAAPHDGLAHAA